jgi:hypothetical protein
LQIIVDTIVNHSEFLKRYQSMTVSIWEEGLLIDFLQKKSIDLWIKKFLVISSYLFNERLLFEHLIRFFSTFVLTYFNALINFEIKNIALVLNLILIFLLVLMFLFVLMLLFILMF